jgi:hypothetical protein
VSLPLPTVSEDKSYEKLQLFLPNSFWLNLLRNIVICMILKSLVLTVILTFPFLVEAQKTNQTITFDALPTKIFGDPSFELTGIASSGLPVSYLSSNIQVATISGTTVTIVSAGQTTITAKQNGDAAFNAAQDVSRTLMVSKANQTITFPDPVFSYTYGDQPFNLGASSDWRYFQWIFPN